MHRVAVGAGYALVRPFGARGLLALALSPVAGAGVIATAALIVPMIGLRWSIWGVIAFWACCVVLALFVRYLVNKRWPGWGEAAWKESLAARFRVEGSTLVGGAVGALIVGGTVARVIGAPENFAQRFDNIFHLNAIRYVLDTGNASPFWVGTLVSGDTAPSFYPTGWHALVSLLVQLFPAVSIPAAVNVATLVVCGLIWVSGVLLLGRTVGGTGSVVALASGIAAGAFSAFPLFFLEWGTLYPNLFGFSMVPAVMALLLMAFQYVDFRSASVSLVAALLGIVSVPAITLVHPSALLFTLFLAFLAAEGRVCSGLGRDLTRRALWTRLATAFSLVAVFVVMWWKIRSPANDSSRHGGTATSAQALGEWLANAQVEHRFALAVSIAVLLGAFFLWKSNRILVVWWVTTGVLYVFTQAIFESDLLNSIREVMTGGFYTDRYRVAALTAMVAIPLAVVGFVQIINWALAVIHRILDRLYLSLGRSFFHKSVTLGALTVVLVLSTQLFVVQATAGKTIQYFRNTPTSEILTDDERAVLDEVAETVPADATIIVNPGTGAAFAYALTGRHVSEAAILNIPVSNVQILRQELDEIDTDPAVCAAVVQLSAYYVLDFGDGNTPGTRYDAGYEGFENLTGAYFTILYQQGQARLLEITNCA